MFKAKIPISAFEGCFLLYIQHSRFFQDIQKGGPCTQLLKSVTSPIEINLIASSSVALWPY